MYCSRVSIEAGNATDSWHPSGAGLSRAARQAGTCRPRCRVHVWRSTTKGLHDAVPKCKGSRCLQRPQIAWRAGPEVQQKGVWVYANPKIVTRG
eukprot:2449183-Rhodomonas_salina.4